MFCDFIQIDDGFYECSRCGVVIETSDNNKPIWICSDQVLLPSNPNLIQKVKNFASSFVNHATNNFKLAEDSEVERRFKICNSCEFFKNNSCSQCGCPINRYKNYISKLSWDNEKCPVNKW